MVERQIIIASMITTGAVLPVWRFAKGVPVVIRLCDGIRVVLFIDCKSRYKRKIRLPSLVVYLSIFSGIREQVTAQPFFKHCSFVLCWPTTGRHGGDISRGSCLYSICPLKRKIPVCRDPHQVGPPLSCLVEEEMVTTHTVFVEVATAEVGIGERGRAVTAIGCCVSLFASTTKVDKQP